MHRDERGGPCLLQGQHPPLARVLSGCLGDLAAQDQQVEGAGGRHLREVEYQGARGEFVVVDLAAEELAAVDAAQDAFELRGVHALVAEDGRRLGDQLHGGGRTVGGGRDERGSLRRGHDVHLDQHRAVERQRVDDQVAVARDEFGGLGERRVPYRTRCLCGLGEAGGDLVAGLVGAGADDRVVRRRLDDLVPGEVQERRVVPP